MGRFKRFHSQKFRSDLGIFSPVLYQLSYLSARANPARRAQAAQSQVVVSDPPHVSVCFNVGESVSHSWMPAAGTRIHKIGVTQDPTDWWF